MIFSVVIHEVAHGFAALALGDRTAEEEGRLTLNPIRHIDPFGTVILPVMSYLLGGIIIGWAKPVPYNPARLRRGKWGPALVGIAGPAANILLALIFGLSLRAVHFLPESSFLLNFISIAAIISLLNLTLAFFNLVPIPPLDGSKLLFALMPRHWYGARLLLEQYGIFLLLFFIAFLAPLLSPIVLFSFRLITGTGGFF
ncbi:MAG: site-2 protease family protein [Candidatus Sungbacteria bacterium]|nr:site-2 protease family protein [Candidatus Sungbacteria bacterium]